MKSIAIITARGGSKRIPRKNIKDFFGQPIIVYSIKAALDSGCFDEVMVSTDDQEIADISKAFGAKVPFLRSQKNSDDFSTTADVLKEVIAEYKKLGMAFEVACCLYPTSVFVTGEKLKNARDLFIKSGADSLIPVVKFGFPIQRALKIKDNSLQFFWPENSDKRSQDLEPSYHDCGQFYFFKTDILFSKGDIFTDNTVPFLVKESEVQDIDNEEDWKIAEIKYQLFGRK
jgi:pseudaminic acid cytidylyltransferase